LNYVYLAFQVDYHNLATVINGLKKINNFVGANITAPFKEIVVGLLDELALEVQQIQAVNTIKNIDNKLKGYNTDGYGFVSSLNEAGINLTDKKILIIGAGGAGRAVAFTVAKMRIRELFLTSRSELKVKKLKDDLDKFSDVKITCIDFPCINDIIKNIDMVVNATPIGLSSDNVLIDRQLLHPELIVYDLNYKKKQTTLLKEALIAGATAINGLSMLVYQAAAAFKIWTTEEAPIDVMKRICLEKFDK